MKSKLNRKDIAFRFDTGISQAEFESIVQKCAKRIKRISSVSIRGPLVFCKVISSSGISEWSFRLDFNDYGHLTGRSWESSNNDDSIIPERLSELIREELSQHDECIDFEKLPITVLKYKRQTNGDITLKSEANNGNTFLWQEKEYGENKWHYLDSTKSNAINLVGSLIDYCSQYRCIVFNNETPICRSAVYKHDIVDETILNMVELLHNEVDGNLLLSVEPISKSKYVWQFFESGTEKWDILMITDNSECIIPSSDREMNRYRCMILINNQPLYLSDVYFDEGANPLNSLTLVTLKYKHEDDHHVLIKVEPKENASYLWQCQKSESTIWEDIKTTSQNLYTIQTSYAIIGDKYRCIIFINDKPAFRSGVYKYTSAKSN